MEEGTITGEHSDNGEPVEEHVRQRVQGFSGAALRTARKRRGWSQADLAAAAGVAEGSVAAWENGASAPTVSRLRLAADALGLTVADLISPGRSAPTLARLREAAGLTLVEAAALAGISKSTLYRAERGYAQLTDERVAALSRIYAVTVDELRRAEAATQRELAQKIRPANGT
jgi:transcriptional regulator with XRE-family HTH domain